LTLVPDRPTDLFATHSVAEELPSGGADALLTQLAPGLDRQAHPRDLSEGQQLALALAVLLAQEADAILLDEPTRGFDYRSKTTLATQLRTLARAGKAVLVASHDMEFLALAADSMIWLAAGQIIAQGGAAEILTAVPAHAPQMAKVFAPLTVLNLNQALAPNLQPGDRVRP
jgi:energy-coupling factor transport system ATP-binding protein